MLSFFVKNFCFLVNTVENFRITDNNELGNSFMKHISYCTPVFFITVSLHIQLKYPYVFTTSFFFNYCECQLHGQNSNQMKFGNSVEIHFSIFKWVINWTSWKFPRLKKDKMIILIRTFDQSTLFCQFQTEVHDVCHCLRTSYDKLSQVLLVRTIQLPNSLMAVSSSDIATEAGLSPSSTG